VIGSDGFSYARDGERSVKIPQLGIVRIDDDVEIGANTCVDRATFGVTWIKQGVKIDNLVQIAHNVEIGEHSIIISQSGVAGSATLGRGVILAGQSGINGHITLGDGAVVAARSGVVGSLPPGAKVSGMPAIAHQEWLRAAAALQQLPRLLIQVRKLQERLDGLEASLE